MTCLTRRLLPFMLALMAGLMLAAYWTYPEKRMAGDARTTCRLNVYRAAGAGDGFGSVASAPARDRVFGLSEVTQTVRILSKPEPQSTAPARAHGVHGVVLLSAVFSSSGQVTDIRILSGLPDGLTEQAIDAMSRIQFLPATIEGRPVSQEVKVEYPF